MFFISILLQIVCSHVIAIDLGSDSVKVAVGSRYRAPHAVYNSYLHKEFPNLFIFKKDNSYKVGEDALLDCKEHPNTCYQSIPLNKNEGYQTLPIKNYEMMALFLNKIVNDVVQKEGINDQYQVIMAINPSMTLREKSYLYAATQIAGFNCVRFVTSTYAPIAYYVNEYYYQNSNNQAIFVDIGNSGVRVSGFEFSRTKATQIFYICADNVGGSEIDKITTENLIRKHYLFLSDQEKQVFSFLVKEAREKLTISNYESFYFKNQLISITKETIESSTYTALRNSLVQIFNQVRDNYGRMLANSPIQVIGGCSQIPCVRALISKILPNSNLYRTMDNFAVALGACYMVTNEITTQLQENNPLVTSNYKLNTRFDSYNIFTKQNYEDFGPVVRLNNVNWDQNHDIVEGDEIFLRFSIDIPNYQFTNNPVDVAFSLNYYLMPVPDRATVIRAYDAVDVELKYTEMVWQISQNELDQSKNYIYNIINRRIQSTSNSNINDYLDLINKYL